MNPTELATIIVDSLLTHGNGEKGDNLGIRKKDKGMNFTNLGGWCRNAAIAKVEGVIRAAETHP